MVHYISYKKRCNNCMQAEGIKESNMILDHTGVFLNKFKNQDSKDYKENLVLEYIKTNCEQNQIRCNICGFANDFIFYDLEVDNTLLGEHSTLNKNNERKLIENHSTLILLGNEIKIVNLSTEELSDLDRQILQAELLLGSLISDKSSSEPNVLNVELIDLNYNSIIIYIDKNQFKIAYTTQDRSQPMGFAQNILFIGHISEITYDDNGQIKEIKGVIYLNLYGSDAGQDYFIIKRNVINIYSKPITFPKNMYLEIAGVKHKEKVLDSLKLKLNNYLLKLI